MSGRITVRTRAAFSFPFLAVLLCAVFFSGSCAAKKDRSVAEKPDLNVCLITIDTLRADRVGYGGHPVETPHLDSLARDGARFMNAVCEVPLTLPSHASILTGTAPPYHKVKNNGTYVLRDGDTTLAEILSDRGYRTAAFMGAFPLDSQFGLDQGFGLYDDRFHNPEHLTGFEPQRTAEEVTRAAADWLGKNAGKKFFVWVHYYDPHLPYTPPPPFDRKYESPYDGEVAYTDVHLGRLLAVLQERSAGRETLVVVVGDHGEGLGEHGEDTHGLFLYDATLRVPLFFHCPDVISAGIDVGGQVRTIDILPTILALLKIPAPRDCQGRSLVPVMEGKESDGEAYAETYLPLLACGWSELKSIRTNRWKYILAPQPELYDLERDPGETDNLIEREPDTASRLLKKLREREAALSSAEAEPLRSALTPEQAEKLSSLGYIAGSPVRTKPGHSKIDPKDRIHIFEDMVRADMALARGAPREAEIILKNIVAEDPENPWLLHFLGKTYQKLGKFEESIAAFTQAVRLNPDDVYSHYLLARSYFQTGKIREARDEASAVLSYFSDHLGSLMLLAEIHAGLGEYDEAVAYLERALNADPDNATARLLFADILTLSKDYERAMEEYKRLRAEMPGDPEVHHHLGMLSTLTGRFEEAVGYFQRAWDLGGDPENLFLLAMAYGKLERYPEAALCMERYLGALPPGETEKRRKASAALRMFRSKRP